MSRENRLVHAAVTAAGWGATQPDDAWSRAAAVVWSCLIEPGDAIAGALVARHGAEDACAALTDETSLVAAAAAAGVPDDVARAAYRRWEPRMRPEAVSAAVSRAKHVGATVVIPSDPDWPAALDDLALHAPPCLWVRGDAGLLAADAVAIVGARAASGYGEHVAAELCAGAADHGLTVVSGAAYGIDGAAHRAAMSAGGTTIAFLAGGCDRPYPAGHTDLIETIVSTGAVVSEVPCGSAPTKWRFLQRNRLIAAATMGTVVVEAGVRSGSLNTAGHAAALGRPLGAVPGPITSASSAGCHRLLREYDAQCVTCTADLVELVGGSVPDLVGAAGQRTDDRVRLLDAMSFRSVRSVSDIAERSGMAVESVHAMLGLLALDDQVLPVEGGWRRVPR
jgi:DNA processing protein